MSRPSRAAIVDRVTAIVEDPDYKEARRWLSEAPGRAAVGVLPVYAPRELIRAAGMLAVGVGGRGDLEIIRGDAYFQSYICHLPRSVVELCLSGRLDFLSGVLFPSTCDVIRNLSGMWQLLKPGMFVRYIDLPQVRGDETGGRFWREEVTALGRDLGELSGSPVTPDSLRGAIADYNEVRRLIGALYQARREAPWSVPTQELYSLMRAGELVPLEDFTTLCRDYLAASEAEPGRPRDNSRVVVVGSFCEQPPLGLIKTIERAGCYIVDDDFLLGNRMLAAPVPTEGDPYAALAGALFNDVIPSPILYEPDPSGKRKLMKARVDAAGADGIIFSAPSFCDPALLDRPMLRAGAEAEGIPCIAFKYSENSGQFQQFREQAGTFSDALKLWDGA